MSPPCPTSLTDDALLAWWAGELATPEQDAIEEHLLSCDGCARRGLDLAALAEGVRGLVRRGELPAVVLSSVVERLRAEGRRIREYHVRPGGGVQCTVSPDDDVVLSRLAAPLEDVPRLDLAIRVGDEAEERLPDVPFDPGEDELVFAPSADWLRSLPAHVQTVRLIAVETSGERTLGEYTFHHSPWPGAGEEPAPTT